MLEFGGVEKTHPTGEPHKHWLCGLLGSGAGDETRTRDINLGKVALYQLSYTRRVRGNYLGIGIASRRDFSKFGAPGLVTHGLLQNFASDFLVVNAG